MTDFEVMPVGTRRAIEDTVALLRKQDGCTYAVAADRLEALLQQEGVK